MTSWDEQRFRAELLEDAALAQLVIRSFLSELGPLHASLRQAAAQQQWGTVKAVAHTLAGSAAQLRLQPLAQTCRALEQRCQENIDCTPLLTELWAQIEEAEALLSSALR